MTATKVLAVVAEVYPLVKTGGLADVAGALPLALRSQGVDTVTLIPGYPAVKAAATHGEEIIAFDNLSGGPARVFAAQAAGLDLFVLDAPHLFDRPGNPYCAPDGQDWPDNPFRFAALSWVAARLALGDAPSFVPDILHGHDWQAGLAMAYLAYEQSPHPPRVMTVHNLAYQGQFNAGLLQQLRLPPLALHIDGVESYGGIGFLKAGLRYADRITTVSPTYAKEIQTPAEGCGYDGLLRGRSEFLSGIRNGINVEVWNPETDPHIASRFSLPRISSRAPNKAALQWRFDLAPEPDTLVFSVISRMVWQKGLDLLADAIPVLIANGAQLVLLGSGEPELERRFTELANEHKGRIGCVLGYDEDLAHLIQAGADAILIPSRYEPCGLTQLCAMRYGTVPVAAKVGGLADTIINIGPHGTIANATGLHFLPGSRRELEAALRRTAALWRNREKWRALQANGMRTDVSWTEPAQDYARLYAELLASKN